jgi:hypothetical protein
VPQAWNSFKSSIEGLGFFFGRLEHTTKLDRTIKFKPFHH